MTDPGHDNPPIDPAAEDSHTPWTGPGADERREDRAQRLHNAMAMEELVAANKSSSATMINLIESVRKETSARDRKVEELEANTKQLRKFTIVAVVVCFLLLCMAIFNAVNVVGTRDIAKDTQRTNDTLLDCLNSTGQCGQFNAQQQKLVLDEVKKYNLTGFYCIRNNPATEDPKAEKFVACMERLYPGGPKLNTPD